MEQEKKLSYTITNTYSTANELTPETRNVWLVCHGIGYLSRYFLRHFRKLDPRENYIIAPQAQSKYYLSDSYTHVGASWLTRENTKDETENVLRYLDEVYQAEQLAKVPNLILLGYSQGVSVVIRWLARRKIRPGILIIHSGKIPAELEPEDFSFLKDIQVKLVYGTEDPYLDQETLEREQERAKALFGESLEIIPFKGGHQVNQDLITQFA